MKHLLAIGLMLFSAASLAAEETHVLIVVGPSNHPPGSHEVAAGGRVLKHLLEHAENVSDLKVDLVEEWPSEELREKASTVVFIGDTFPANRFPHPEQNLADLSQMMNRGCGIVCIHYATGLLGQDVTKDGDHPLLRWMGGYFANRSCPHHESIARIYPEAKIEPAAIEHPVSRGWKEFVIHDEPYTNNYFGPDNNTPAANVTILATSMLPPQDPKEEAVAWCVERPDSGRGFGIVMPHFYKNWRDDDLRTFILNAVVWTAQKDVPKNGVQTSSPKLKTFDPAAVEFQPRKKK
ncbi:MAG: ThuA domain-containing protein [Planctomycetaceae bacterium]|nr:ThuA domain-containing protein [Planctomycetaceae bacterium]